MRIRDRYKLGKIISETENSILYEAKRYKGEDSLETDELRFVVKIYKENEVPDSAVKSVSELEKTNSQLVENVSRVSVVIPVLETSEEGAIVMQLKSGGIFLSELISAIDESDTALPIEIALLVIRRLLNSLDILHNCFKDFDDRKGFIHMDIHPGNVYLDNLDRVKVNALLGETASADIEDLKGLLEGVNVKFIDMGSSLLMDKNGRARRAEHMTFTPGYSAPEVLDPGNTFYKENEDIYSAAAILKDMAGGFLDKNEGAVSSLIMKILDIGLQNSSRYRYTSASDMGSAVDDAIRLQDAINKIDYIETASLAYKMNIDIDTLKKGASVMNQNAFRCALYKLREMQLTVRPNIEKIVYDFEYLKHINELSKEISKSAEDEIIPDSIQDRFESELIYLGLSSYNNVGDTEKALELIERFDDIKDRGFTSVSDYINITNRLAVTFYDAGDFRTAAIRQWDNIEILEKMYDTFKVISVETGLSMESEDITKNLGRAYSGYGRFVYSIGMRTESEQDKKAYILQGVKYLEKALNIFGEDSGNRMITMTHIMHIAAETGNRQLFEKYKDEYFGCGNPSWSGVSIEDFIAGKDKTDYCTVTGYDYTLRALIKCINTFYIDYIRNVMHSSSTEEKTVFLGSIRRLIENLEGRNVLDFPANLILAYLGDMIYEINGNVADEDVRYLYKLATTSNDDFRIDTRSMTVETVISYQLMWKLYEMELMGCTEDEREMIMAKKAKLFDDFLERAENGGSAVKEYFEVAVRKKTLEEMVYFI